MPGTNDADNSLNPVFPLSRVKKIMKQDPDVGTVNTDAIVAVAFSTVRMQTSNRCDALIEPTNLLGILSAISPRNSLDVCPARQAKNDCVQGPRQCY